MSDVSIRQTAVTVAPLDYKVPGAQEILPKAVAASMDGTSAGSPWYPCLQLVDPAGNVMWSAVPQTILAAGVSADVSWFPHVAATASSFFLPGVTSETLFVDTRTTTGTLSSTVLVSGVTYTVIVEGDYSQVNLALDKGTPNSVAMFPTPSGGRVSTQVGIDAETLYAYASSVPGTIGHATNFQISLDGGVTYSHREPSGGPYSVPNSGHLYTYTLVGQGQVAGFWPIDTPGAYADNYGELKVTIQVPNGTGSGSGAGSLVPPTSATNNGDALVTLGGIPVWNAVDGGSP